MKTHQNTKKQNTMRVLWKPERHAWVTSRFLWTTYALTVSDCLCFCPTLLHSCVVRADSARHLSEERHHWKECIPTCVLPHILSLTHSIRICPFYRSAGVLSPGVNLLLFELHSISRPSRHKDALPKQKRSHLSRTSGFSQKDWHNNIS